MFATAIFLSLSGPAHAAFAPLQGSVGVSAGADADVQEGWRFCPGLRADLSWGRRSTEDAGYGVALRVDTPAAASFRAGAGPELITPLGGGAQLVSVLGPLVGPAGFGAFARVSLAAKSPNVHGFFGMQSGLFVEVSAQDFELRSHALTTGIELDLGLLMLPVLAAARPFGRP